METRIRILVVEDDIELRSLLGKTLSREGFFVQTVSNYDDAVAQLNAGEEVDMLLSSLRLTGKGGDELARTVLETHPALRIVLMIAYGDQHRIEDLLKQGVGTIMRPFKIPDLLDVIDNVLEASGKTGNG